MSTTEPVPMQNPLDAAKAIVTALGGMDTGMQILAIRFATETLGLAVQPAVAPALPTHVQPSAAGNQTPPSQHAGAAHAAHPVDIKQFALQKAARSQQQFAAVVSYFYQFVAPEHLRRDSIDAAVLKEAARLAGQPQSADWNMTLHNAKAAGYVDAVGKAAFRLNSVGENLVAIGLPEGGTAAATKQRRSPSRRPRVAAVKKAAKKPNK